jgi:Flp pilus assembly protein TadD
MMAQRRSDQARDDLRRALELKPNDAVRAAAEAGLRSLDDFGRPQ